MEEDKEIFIKLLTYFRDYGPTSDFGEILNKVSRKKFDSHMGKLFRRGMIQMINQPKGCVYVTSEKGCEFIIELTT